MIRATTTLKRKNLNNKKGIDNEKSTGKYTARDFIDNLSLSIGTGSDSLYPEKANKIFQINNLVDLRLIKNKTYIYINNKRFVQCFNVLFNIGSDKGGRSEDIKNMDEASHRLRGGYSGWFTRISPEEEFMAHCSNIQAFFENDLNTDLLHSDIAFPLLRKLVSVGYKPAEGIFNKEIVKRYNEGTWETRWFLKSEGYLKYLNKEEKQALKKDELLESFTRYYDIPKSRDSGFETFLDENFKFMVSRKEELEGQGTESDLELLKSLSRDQIKFLLLKFKMELGWLPKGIEIDGKKYDIREISRNYLGAEINELQISPKEVEDDDDDDYDDDDQYFYLWKSRKD